MYTGRYATEGVMCLILEGFTAVAKEAEASLERLLQFDPTAIEA